MTAKAALLLDFDNVFSSLWRHDPAAAVAFGSRPQDWLKHLAGGRRRWLVLRCYLNPAGWLASDEESGDRLYYSRFRPMLTRAGFEVVDCPALTHAGSNAADIRLVLDAVDLLRAECRYDEFVIASGDSDFAPLLRRLRAQDRRVTVIAPDAAAPAYTALSDELIGYGALRSALVPDAPDPAAAFLSVVQDRYREAAAPICLTELAQALMTILPGIQAGGWGGAGTFSAAIGRMNLPGAKLAANHLWDEGRHAPPPGSLAAAA